MPTSELSVQGLDVAGLGPVPSSLPEGSHTSQEGAATPELGGTF